MKVRITDRCFYFGSHAERISGESETKRANTHCSEVNSPSRIFYFCIDVNLIYTCRKRRITEHGIFHCHCYIELRYNAVTYHRTFYVSRKRGNTLCLQSFKIFGINSRDQR